MECEVQTPGIWIVKLLNSAQAKLGLAQSKPGEDEMALHMFVGHWLSVVIGDFFQEIPVQPYLKPPLPPPPPPL